MEQRRQNVATKLAPIWRTRNVLPLTSAHVRNEQIEAGELQRTPLDKLLTTQEADSLESYVLCEDILSGNARCADYTGDRVQSSRIGMSPVADNRLAMLRTHAAIKHRLTPSERDALSQFVRQQAAHADALSDAQLGLMLDPASSDASAAWQRHIAGIAAVLAAIARSL